MKHDSDRDDCSIMLILPHEYLLLGNLVLCNYRSFLFIVLLFVVFTVLSIYYLVYLMFCVLVDPNIYCSMY